ncbi:hypothetical protein P5V15_001415 [Pogonomyrmex californicus]
MSNSKKNSDCNQKKVTVLEEPQTNVKKKEDTSTRPKCELDSNGCLNLQNILLMFDSPVSQERAWALCYQIANSLSCSTENMFYEISELSQIILHKNGDIWFENLAGSKQLVSEEKAVFSLGMTIFKALDFGSNAGEEIALLPDLEALITLMTNCNRTYEGIEERLQETDDEGIERDSGDTDAEDYMISRATESYTDNSKCTLKTVLQICARHIQNSHEDVDNYYRNVIQTFVEEALNLSQFLEKIVVDKQDLISPCNIDRSSTSLQNIDTLDFNDWTDIRIWRAIQARFWVQVISELRRGVKLKKVEANMSSRTLSREQGSLPDYKLTPYESLMNDIRERRYHLRKTPPTPSRKDAHAIILEFIRSRPPLKKASERRLRPLQKESTLRELLMESIKKPPKPLRPSGWKQNASKIEEMSIYLSDINIIINTRILKLKRKHYYKSILVKLYMSILNNYYHLEKEKRRYYRRHSCTVAISVTRGATEPKTYLQDNRLWRINITYTRKQTITYIPKRTIRNCQTRRETQQHRRLPVGRVEKKQICYLACSFVLYSIYSRFKCTIAFKKCKSINDSYFCIPIEILLFYNPSDSSFNSFSELLELSSYPVLKISYFFFVFTLSFSHLILSDAVTMQLFLNLGFLYLT